MRRGTSQASIPHALSVAKLNIEYLMLSVTCILARFDALHCILISNPFSLLRSGQRNAVKISIQKSNEKNHEARGIHDNQAQHHHHSTKLLQSIDKRWRHFSSHWSSPVIPKTNVNGIKKNCMTKQKVFKIIIKHSRTSIQDSPTQKVGSAIKNSLAIDLRRVTAFRKAGLIFFAVDHHFSICRLRSAHSVLLSKNVSYLCDFLV
jgi:predicted nucleic acid-binding protein